MVGLLSLICFDFCPKNQKKDGGGDEDEEGAEESGSGSGLVVGG